METLYFLRYISVKGLDYVIPCFLVKVEADGAHGLMVLTIILLTFAIAACLWSFTTMQIQRLFFLLFLL